MSVLHSHALCPQKPEKNSGSPGNDAVDSVSSHLGARNLNLGPRDE